MVSSDPRLLFFQRYETMKASVEKTDGEEILDTIANRMNKLVKEKVDAVLVSNNTYKRRR